MLPCQFWPILNATQLIFSHLATFSATQQHFLTAFHPFSRCILFPNTVFGPLTWFQLRLTVSHPFHTRFCTSCSFRHLFDQFTHLSPRLTTSYSFSRLVLFSNTFFSPLTWFQLPPIHFISAFSPPAVSIHNKIWYCYVDICFLTSTGFCQKKYNLMLSEKTGPDWSSNRSQPISVQTGCQPIQNRSGPVLVGFGPGCPKFWENQDRLRSRLPHLEAKKPDRTGL